MNNAGFNYVAPLEVTSMETFQRLADVMLFGTVRVTKGFLPLIRKAKGTHFISFIILDKLIIAICI